jgi:hypothetical protein
LEIAGTITDYLFINGSNNFYILTVEIIIPGEAAINVMFDINDKSPTPQELQITVTQAQIMAGTVVISIKNSVLDFDSIRWFYNHTLLAGTGASQTISSDINFDYLILGDHYFTVEAIKGGVLYTALITLTVTVTP